MTSHLHIHLLGEFRLFVDDQAFDSLYQPRLQALLAYLLLHRQTPQLRQQIAFHFWPDSSEKQAYTNLRKLFFQLRRVLPQADKYLTADSLYLGWRNDATFTLDVAEVEQALDQLEQTDRPDATTIDRVVALYRGELLPACYDEWLLPLQRGLHKRLVDTLTKALVGLEAWHEYQAGLHTATHLLRLEPLHEAAYRHLMHLRALTGDRTGALRAYHECATTLQQELGVSPATETQALYQQLLKAEPHTAPAPDRISESRHEHTPFVGRKHEWQVLHQAWRQAESRGPHLVTVWGEAGIGKTRLLEELLRWAKLQSGTVAYARTYAAEGALSYAPVTEWLRSDGYRDVLAELADTWRIEMARLLPELLDEQPGLPPAAPVTESWQRQRFYEALARAMLAGPQPTLLVLDDLQWCDAEMLEWLRYLLRFDTQASLLVVGAVRSEAVDATHALHELRQELQREAQWAELELAPLNVDETAVLAGYLTDEDVTPWQTWLFQETEGNPLYIVEMMQSGSLVRQNNAPDEGVVALPATVQSVITARLGRLSSAACQLAQAAATIGRVFSVEVLAAVSELDEDAFAQGMDELWQRRIVREQRDGYDFSHDKIREVAYGRMAPMRRRLLHRRVARTIEQFNAHHVAEVAGQLAAHYEQAMDTQKAVAYMLMAGEHASARFAYNEALSYIARALKAASDAEIEQRFRLLRLRATIYQARGRFQSLYQDLPALQQLAVALDQLQGASRHQADLATLRACYSQGTGNFIAAAKSAQQATELARQSDEAEIEAGGYLEWGLALWSQGQMQPAHHRFASALALARRAGNPRLEARALEFLSQTGMFSGAPEAEIWNYLVDCLALHRQTNNLAGEASVYNKLGYVTVAQNKNTLAKAKSYYDKALDICRRISGRALEETLLSNLGVLYIFSGDYRNARLHLELSLKICRELHKVRSEGVVQNYLGYESLQRGDYSASKRHQEEALKILMPVGHLQWRTKAHNELGLLYLEMNDLVGARAQVQQAIRIAREVGDSRQEAAAYTSYGHVLSASAEPDEATVVYQQAFTLYQKMSQYSRCLEPLAGMADLAAQRCDLSQARQMVEQVLDYLSKNELYCTDATLRIYMTCYRVLLAVDDPRAGALLDSAYAQLQARSQTLDTEDEQSHFWSAPSHQVVLAAR